MKWKEIDFNKGISTIKAVLLFGPDAGQIDVFCDKAIEKLEVPKDNVLSVDVDEFRDKLEAVFAESCTPSMFGGGKIVIISGAGDIDTNVISEFISCPSLCATVIVTAGDLRQGSLRRLFEDSKESYAALACYTDDNKKLEELIHKELSYEAGIKQVTPDAMSYMLAHLGGDRNVTKGFLQKIAIYVSSKHIVDLEDVEKCLPDTSALSIDDFIYSLTVGEFNRSMLALDKLLYAGLDANFITRVLYNHFNNLLIGIVDGKLPSRLFWRSRDNFSLAIKVLSESDIIDILAKLVELEKKCRTKGFNPELLLRDFSLKLALKCAKLSLKRRK